MKIQGLTKINHEGEVFRNLFQRICSKHLPADGHDWDLNSRHLTDKTGPWTCCVQNHAGLNRALRCFHCFNLIIAHADSCDLYTSDRVRSQSMRRADISDDNTVRIDKPIFLMECSRKGIVKFHQR